MCEAPIRERLSGDRYVMNVEEIALLQSIRMSAVGNAVGEGSDVQTWRHEGRVRIFSSILTAGVDGISGP